MPYVLVQGNSGDRSRREKLAVELAETVATLFAVPRRFVVVVVNHAGKEIVVSTGGHSYLLDLEVTLEGAGIREDEMARVVQEVTEVASRATAIAPDRIMVLVKVPGGPHMRMTSNCCGIGGQLLA